MKKLAIILFFTFGFFAFSQGNTVEKAWDTNPVFEGGSEAFQKEISNALKFVVHQNYFVDGKVKLLFQIDEKGKYKIVSVEPTNLQNKQAFIDDMNFMFKRFKKRWIPAQSKGEPVKSFITYNINFHTMTYDEE